MGITNEEIQKALKIRRAVADYFETNNESKVLAKDLMPLFISRGIFPKDHKDGLPIREFLRKLDENNDLKLIPQVMFQQKDINKNWYFIKTSI